MLSPIVLLLVAGAMAQSCFYPSGTQTGADTVPCNNTGSGFTHCCTSGDVCISNGFCFGAAQAMVRLSPSLIQQRLQQAASTITKFSRANIAQQVYRGACTDSSFNSTKCPQSCTDYQTDDFANIWKCPAPYDQDLFWCGANSAKMCGATDEGTFSWPDGRNMIIAAAAAQSGAATSVSPASQTVGSSTACAATATATISVLAGTSFPLTGQVSWTVALATGLGVGVPLAILALALGFLYVRERKMRRREREQVLATGGVRFGGEAGGPGGSMVMKHGREDRKLLANNEVYEMYDSNLQEMYAKPEPEGSVHEVKDPNMMYGAQGQQHGHGHGQGQEQEQEQQRSPGTQSSPAYTPVSPLGREGENEFMNLNHAVQR